MSTKKDYISNFSDVLNRLHKISGKGNEYEIADLLGFKKDTFAARKSRGSIPKKEIKLACVSNGWNFEWVMHGKGPMKIEVRAAPPFTALDDYKMKPADPEMLEIMDILENDLPELKPFVLKLLRGRKDVKEGLKGFEIVEVLKEEG